MIEVEVKIVGMFGLDYLAVARRLTLGPGATVKDALAQLHAAGAIDQAVHEQVVALRPPLFLVINDEKVSAKGITRRLADGDVVAVLQLSAGG